MRDTDTGRTYPDARSNANTSSARSDARSSTCLTIDCKAKDQSRRKCKVNCSQHLRSPLQFGEKACRLNARLA